MKNARLVLLLGFFLLLVSDAQMMGAPSEKMIADFESPQELEKIHVGPGVTINLTTESAVSGTQALEVHVGKFADHQNQWPTIELGPKYITEPFDASEYSRFSIAITNTSEQLATVRPYFATLPYNDHGINVEGQGYVIPGGMTMVCDYSTFLFERNDCSKISFFQIIFPPLEEAVVYRIDALKLVYDPASGSPREKLSQAVTQLQQQAQKQGTLKSETDTLARDFSDALANKTFLGRYLEFTARKDELVKAFGRTMFEKRKGFVTWRHDPYVNLPIDAAPGLAAQELQRLDLTLAGNESRDAAFMVSPAQQDLSLSVNVAGDTIPAEAMEVFYVDGIDNRRGQMVADILVPAQGPIAVPLGQSREIRIRFDTQYHSIPDGKHNFTVTLTDAAGDHTQTFDGTVTVYPFRLPDSDVLPCNTYPQFFADDFSKPEIIHQAVRTMKTFGLNLIYVEPVFMPRVLALDEDYQITQIDETPLRNHLSAVLSAWKSLPGDQPLRFVVANSSFYAMGLDRKDIVFPGVLWRQVFEQWLTRIVAIMDENDIDRQHWWLTFGDEANESRLLQNEIPIAETVKSIDPTLQTLCNSSAVLQNEQTTTRFYQAFDVLQPDFDALIENKYLQDFVAASGRTVWTYNCRCEMNILGKDIYKYYRVYGWDIEPYNLKGIGLWVANVRFKNEYNWGCELMVSRDGQVLQTRRLAMFRDGLCDYRYIYLLKELAAQKNPAALNQAQSLITQALADINQDLTATSRTDKWRSRLAEEIITLSR